MAFKNRFVENVQQSLKQNWCSDAQIFAEIHLEISVRANKLLNKIYKTCEGSSIRIDILHDRQKNSEQREKRSADQCHLACIRVNAFEDADALYSTNFCHSENFPILEFCEEIHGESALPVSLADFSMWRPPFYL